MASRVWIVVAAVLLLLPLVQNELAEGKGPVPRKELGTVPPLDLSGSTAVDRYMAFMSTIQRVLGDTTASPPIHKGFVKRPVLGVQKYKPDVLNVTLKGPDGLKSTLAIRTDSIYLVGFNTTAGSWYTFQGDERFVTGSASLGFASDYGSLKGKGGHKNLRDVVLGRKAMQDAIATLGRYTRATPEREIKDALTSLVVMVCEASRFAPIRAAVQAAWVDTGKLPGVVVELVVVWKDTSCALLVWNRDPKKNKWAAISEVTDRKLAEKGDPKMKSAEAAVENVDLIIHPTTEDPCSDGKTAAVDY